jgi:hypothetical protein
MRHPAPKNPDPNFFFDTPVPDPQLMNFVVNKESLKTFFLWNSVEESGPEEWVQAAISLAQV